VEKPWFRMPARHTICTVWGYSRETSQDLLHDLLDPIDTERDADAVFKLGLSAQLMDRMGSP
jgi:hypothetical protein